MYGAQTRHIKPVESGVSYRVVKPRMSKYVHRSPRLDQEIDLGVPERRLGAGCEAVL